jgi:hypothetical protein
MPRSNEQWGRRISAVLVGYAGLLLLVQELGQRVLDLVWAALTAPVGWLLHLGNELLAATDAATGGPLLDLVLVLLGVGFAGIARLLLWPVTVESSATEPPRGGPLGTPSPAARVVTLPVTEPASAGASKQRRAA